MHYAELKQAWAELTKPGAPFEIELQSIRGQDLRCYKHAPPNLRAFWLSTAAFGPRDYLVYQDERLTYADCHKITAAIGAWCAVNNIRTGDRVAIAMRNYPEWMLIYWACVSLGIAVVGMNAWWTAEEMAYAFGDSAPKAAFCDVERLSRILDQPAIAAGVKLVAVRTPAPDGCIAWADVIATPGPMPDADLDGDMDACIFYTSGTTGFPKGAQLTHRGCLTNLMNMVFSTQVQALATFRATGQGPDPSAPAPIPRGLITTPLFHVTANNCGAYLITAAGGTIVLMYRWDAGEALRLIEKEKITGMSGVPVMAREVLTHPDFAKFDTASLMTLGGGGAQLPPDLVLKIDREVATARPNTGYGMTETCGIITAVAGDFFIDRADSAGPAMPSFEAKCVADDGSTVPMGQIGELWVRGAGVIKGYINKEKATAESITDGWLHTGDIARIDEDGFIYIVDRKKDMVLRGGENVYCAEVEASLYRHPAIAECSVFGVPDDRLGEEVAAAITPRAGMAIDTQQLREFCQTIIAKHKIPRYIWVLEDGLPRNASGKFLKRQLRDMLRLADAV